MMDEPDSRELDPIRKEYGRLAGKYDSRWSFYIEATARETLARISPVPGTRVLDVGCGTGVLLQRLHAASPDLHLAGLDPVAEMLAVARARLPDAVELHIGRAEKLPFADGSFDLVISNSVLHFLRCPAAALREMRRVLRSGGKLVITDWCRDYPSCRLLDAALRISGRVHVRTLSSRELEAFLEDAGFVDVCIDRYRIDWFWGMMTARAGKDVHHGRGIDAHREPDMVGDNGTSR